MWYVPPYAQQECKTLNRNQTAVTQSSARSLGWNCGAAPRRTDWMVVSNHWESSQGYYLWSSKNTAEEHSSFKNNQMSTLITTKWGSVSMQYPAWYHQSGFIYCHLFGKNSCFVCTSTIKGVWFIEKKNVIMFKTPSLEMMGILLRLQQAIITFKD